jgi:hypothetical protein
MKDDADSEKSFSCSQTEEALKNLKGIVAVMRLTDDDKKEAERLEKKADEGVLMGICKGINIGLFEALQKKNVFACVSDETLVWPKESYVLVICGDELVGQDIYDEAKLQELKNQGEIVAGNLVFYRNKVNLFRERREEARVHMLAMQIPELKACGAVVASPAPPVDLFIREKFGLDPQDSRLGSIVVGVD